MINNIHKSQIFQDWLFQRIDNYERMFFLSHSFVLEQYAWLLQLKICKPHFGERRSTHYRNSFLRDTFV